MGKLKYTIVPVTPFQQNCTIVYDEESMSGVVVDPGGEQAKILTAIEKLAVTIEAIWLTHGHVDHVGGVMAAKSALGVEAFGPQQQDQPLFDHLQDQARAFGLHDAIQNFLPDHWLKDGDVLTFGTQRFNVFHIPGHSPGHVIYFNQTARLALVGDVLFKGSIGRTDLYGGSLQTLLQAIKTKILPLGDDVLVIPGHGPTTTIGFERCHNRYVQES